MEKIELSIIVPVYNVEIYLKECLDSIYNIKNIKKEIILINDGSTDLSLNILNDYKKQYPEITKIINKKNTGLSDTRNIGLKEAKGEYIYFIDSDDFIDSLKFEKIFKIGKEKNIDIIKSSGYYLKNSEIKNLDKKIIKSGIYNGRQLIKLLHRNKIIRVEVWLSIYKLDFLKELDIKFEKGLLYEDTIFSYKCWLNCFSILYVNENFYYYRVRKGSIMNSNKEKENFKYKLVNCNLLLKEQQKKDIQINEIYSLILNICLVGILRFNIYSLKVLKNLDIKNLKWNNKLKLILLIAFIKILKGKNIEV